MRLKLIKIWDVLYPLVFFLLCLAAVTIVTMIIAGFIAGTAPDAGAVSKVPVFAIVIDIAFYAITFLTQWRVYKKDDLRFGERKNRWSAWELAASAVIAAAVSAALNALILISPLPRLFPGYSEGAEATFAGQSPILLILATVILAPLAEELIFRGMVYERMKHYLGIPVSIVLTSLLFGLYHGNMIQFIYATLVGLLLAYYYEKSGSLLASIIAHMAMNALAVTSFL